MAARLKFPTFSTSIGVKTFKGISTHVNSNVAYLSILAHLAFSSLCINRYPAETNSKKRNNFNSNNFNRFMLS